MSDEIKIIVPVAYGKKVGMTRVFDKEGRHTPVTVVQLYDTFVSQVKNKEKDQVNSYQLAFREKREKLINNPIKGILKKANIERFFASFAEIKMDQVDPAALGKQVSYGHLEAGSTVDVSGRTKGKGFQGVIKRYGFSGGPATHGSHFHRKPGAIGNRATPARVFKRKKMPGHMGDVNQTVQNLTVVEYNLEKSYVLIRGAVPGSKNSIVKISQGAKI